uniref:Uncharacterized protein n=1 Tax=Branchiostoma floridae TaxID=7739 RepID=C3YWH4_BRAFL|eukprot:XP_002599206.1 hypothetical protein BRAFLDRAFT_64441 [Branchiostoma floridae]
MERVLDYRCADVMSRYQLVFVELPAILEVSREDDTLDSEGQEEFSSSSGCEYSFADFKDILSPVKNPDSPTVTSTHPESTARNGSCQRTAAEDACASIPPSGSNSTAGQVAGRTRRSNKRSRSSLRFPGLTVSPVFVRGKRLIEEII